ncbi:MAG TPA: hypothetical protein VE999_14385 [Gemmataceae bacterium]|nr:hypothetical protein [Gemmataceae bacterium]
MANRRTGLCWLLACILLAVMAPRSLHADAVLRQGEAITLRIRQVLPADGLSPGERLLNSRQPIQPGDRFLAEIIDPPCSPPALVGGSVTGTTPPGWFGRPGSVTLQLSQLVERVDGQTRLLPWQIDLADRRLSTQARRILLTALFGLEGAGLGAVIGAQTGVTPKKILPVSAGAGVGLILGLGYASFQRGREPILEPGDTFRLIVGTTSCQPLPRDLQTILYPAASPNRRKTTR